MAITFHPNGKIEGINNANFDNSLSTGHVVQTQVTTAALGSVAASGDIISDVNGLAVSITPSLANSKFFLTCTGVNGHCNMQSSGNPGNHGCRYYFQQSVNGGSYVNVDGSGNYSNPICSTHINGDIGSWSDYPVNYSFLADPTYTLGQAIIFRPAFGKDTSMGNSFTYYFSHNTNGIRSSFIVQEITQ